MILLGLSYFYTQSPTEIPPTADKETLPERPHKSPDHKHEYNDYFFATRAYPDKAFDFLTYEKNLNTIKEQINDPTFKANMPFSDEWRVEGPYNIGGRINAIAVDPFDEGIIYAGSADGGVFKTTDGGDNWVPIFDQNTFLTIGTIEIDPTDNNTIYVGTGDINIGGYVAVGDGLYRSTDAGETWEHLGLTEQRMISKVKVDFNDPNTLYVGTMGLPFERNEERGLYKSTDGGQTWEQNLYIDNDAGIIDLVMDHSDPQTLYAASWNRIRNNSESTTFGDDARIWKTTDGGDNWTMLQNGLPMGEQSRIGLAMSPYNPQKLYAFYVDTTHNTQGLYQTINGGESWIPFNVTGLQYTETGSDAVGGFGWYFAKIGINPNNDDHVYVLGVDLWQTTDFGSTWSLAAPVWWTYEVHADKHAMVLLDDNTFLLGTDGGIYKTSNGGSSWIDIEDIPNTQLYRVANNPHNTGAGEYFVGCQDNGTTAGNYESTNWPRVYGGDGFQPIIHPENPDIIYAETQNGNIVVSNNGGEWFNDFTLGINPEDRRYWDMPYIMSPHNSDVLYTGTEKMYKTNNGINASWQPISPTLTLEVIDKPLFHSITALDESPVTQGQLYVGTLDAQVWTSPDDGETWLDISEGLPTRFVTSIKGSPTDANTVYITHSGYKDNDNISHIHKSTDNGNTWIDLSGNMPNIACNDILIYPESNDSTLFVATDAGVYASTDAGTTWDRLGNNMPLFKIFDLDFNLNNNRLLAATFARSLWSYSLQNIVGVVDEIAPILTVATDEIIWGCSIGIFPQATAIDNIDGDLTESIVIDDSNVSYGVNGEYPIIYTVTDEAGNTATFVVNLVIECGDPGPVINIDSEPTIEIWQGEDFEIPDATAFDPAEGDISDLIEIEGQVDTDTPGTYILTYSLTDSSGNTTTVTITVIVMPDTEAPTFAYNGEYTFDILAGEDFNYPYVEAEDNAMGDVTYLIMVDDSQVDWNTPGMYELYYVITDNAGNTNTLVFYINVTGENTSIEQLASIQWNMYPNPTQDQINFQIDKTIINEIEYIFIQNMTGQILQKLNKYHTSINVEHLSAGIYTIQIQLKNGKILNKKFQKL